MKKEGTSTARGFTLVELLVVMAILAVLIGISVAGLGYAMRRSRNISRQAAMANINRALEAHYSDEQDYPTHESLGTGGAAFNELIGNILHEYLEGSWESPAKTEVYYRSNDGYRFSVCVSQEESGGNVSFVCQGNGIGEDHYPPSEQQGSCDYCLGVCGLWDPDTQNFTGGEYGCEYGATSG